MDMYILLYSRKTGKLSFGRYLLVRQAPGPKTPSKTSSGCPQTPSRSADPVPMD